MTTTISRGAQVAGTLAHGLAAVEAHLTAHDLPLLAMAGEYSIGSGTTVHVRLAQDHLATWLDTVEVLDYEVRRTTSGRFHETRIVRLPETCAVVELRSVVGEFLTQVSA